MKVYITKYALTQGVLELEGEEINTRIVEVWAYGHFYGNDWHQTKEEAIKRANKMRENKIISLKRKLQYLEKLTF